MIPGKNKGAGFAESFIYAAAGIRNAWKGRNFRVQLLIACIAVVLGFLFKISLYEWALVVLCISLVLACECLNAAIEAAIDLMSPQIHPLAKTAKDCAAGAVLVLSVSSFIIALLIFIPKII